MKVFVLFAVTLLALPAALIASEPAVKLAMFDVDATPPVGSAMAYDPVKRIDELGFVPRHRPLGAGKPIVLCAVDWLGIANEGHDAFRERWPRLRERRASAWRCIPCISTMPPNATSPPSGSSAS